MSLKPVELLAHDYLINHISMQYNRDKEKEFFYYANRKPTNPNNSRQFKPNQIRPIKGSWYSSVRKNGLIKLKFKTFL